MFFKDSFTRQRLACAFWFACAGITYGIFTSRMPALKELTGANDGQVGFLLLAFGAASFCGLATARTAIARFGAKKVTTCAVLVFMIALTLGALAFSWLYLALFCILAGLGTGFCDVGMNAQGMMIEKRHNILCMASLHACFSLGGVAGALSGSLFAALELSPFANFAIICAICLVLLPWSARNAIGGAPEKAAKTSSRGHLPKIIYFYGFMSMLCYVSEGSVGEWGSVLLHSVKGASQQQAALVFAAFCVPMVICRFMTDKLRKKAGDFSIVLCGAIICLSGMSTVLLSPWPVLCIAAYFAMGIGFAPVVPILYSRAGKIPGISPGRASSAMSLLSYTGLLVFPPFLGMLGDAIGLGNALWIIAGLCICLAGGSFALRQREAS